MVLAVLGLGSAASVFVLTNDAARSDAAAAKVVVLSYLDLMRGPKTHWERGDAADSIAGVLDDKLRLTSDGSARAFLLVQGGRLVYEWYRPAKSAFDAAIGPNKRLGTAAAAKGLVGSLLLGLALQDGVVAIDDLVSRYIPSWASDTIRSRITIRQLATHSAGVENVSFRGDEDNQGWKATYNADPEQRFSMARHTAPILFEPGTRYDYSGVGFYVLAYVLAQAFAEHGVDDIRALLQKRVFDPIEIHEDDWIVSYGTAYSEDGLRLYAIGSGASLTARAAARIGQLLVQKGMWGGRLVLSPGVVETLTTYGGTAKPARVQGEPEPLPALGWWTNGDGVWERAPRDAFVAAGTDHQIILVIPSLELVAVRIGAPLDEERWGPQYWTDLESLFVNPLIESLDTLQVQATAIDPESRAKRPAGPSRRAGG
jgi:CubicO group peptidase (beta-lactamase class C family)